MKIKPLRIQHFSTHLRRCISEDIRFTGVVISKIKTKLVVNNISFQFDSLLLYKSRKLIL